MSAPPGGGGVDAQRFRSAMGRFATGVTVVTTQVDGVLHGMTANAFASLSLDPLLVLVCVDRSATMHALLQRATGFGVTVLGLAQEGQSLFFASPERPGGREQFTDVAWRPAPVTGSPLLEGGLAFLDCRVRDLHDGGDHTIFVGEVLDVALGEGEPLVWFAGGYHRLVPGGDPAPAPDGRLAG